MLKDSPKLFINESAPLNLITKKDLEREISIRNVIDIFRNSLEMSEIKGSFVSEVGKLFKADRCCISLYSPEKDKFLNIDKHSEYLSSNSVESIIGSPIQKNTSDFVKSFHLENKPIVIYDLETYIEDAAKRNINLEGILGYHGYKSRYGFPIFIDSQFIGSFIFHYLKQNVILSNEDIQILKIFAEQIGIAIKHARLYEEARQETKKKSNFTANIINEIKIPVTDIIYDAQWILFKEEIENTEYFLNKISSTGEFLLNLVNDLNVLYKIESEAINLNYEILNSKKLINSAIAPFKILARKNKIILKTNLVKAYVKADEEKVLKIIQNLLSNAIKFTKAEGEVSVESSLVDDKLIIEVKDSGTGIAKVNYNKLFYHCEQIGFEQPRSYEGSGLGLTLAKYLVELHKGSLHFESEEGKGSRFWFVLPEAASNKNVYKPKSVISTP